MAAPAVETAPKKRNNSQKNSATLKEEDFEVVVVRSLNEITDDIYDLEEFVNTITDMGIWLYSLEVGPVPITVSHAEDFGC